MVRENIILNYLQVEKQDMDDDTYDTFKPTSVKPTVREYKVYGSHLLFSPKKLKSFDLFPYFYIS